MIFDARTLDQLRKTQEASMMHECTIEPYIVGEDGTISYGEPSAPIPCGFDAHSGTLTGHEVYETISAGASIRLPLGTDIGMKYRITLIKSFDQLLPEPRVFEVVDFPDTFGPSGGQIEVREIYS
ncbi:MAG: hypothetical protein IJU38_07080 [Clostridia bacterium]|nr:hypothetical protein [Clostridia bacterium]